MFLGKSLCHKSFPTVANTAAVVTLVGKPGVRRWIPQVEWSYSQAPTTGLLTVEHGVGNIVKEYTITRDGPDSMKWNAPMSAEPGVMIRVTLSAGGNKVIGKLMVNELFPSVDQG